MALSQSQIRQDPFRLLSVLSKQNLVKTVRLSGLEQQALRELNASRAALDLAPKPLEQQLAERLREWIERQLRAGHQPDLINALVVVAHERQQLLSSPSERRLAGQLSVWLQAHDWSTPSPAPAPAPVRFRMPEQFVQPRLF